VEDFVIADYYGDAYRRESDAYWESAGFCQSPPEEDCEIYGYHAVLEMENESDDGLQARLFGFGDFLAFY
jgi:hypothetical protein